MTQITWANCQVTLGELQPWADNPRLSTKTQARRLLESWQRFGQVQTIAIGPAGQVYDGHQRLSALLTLHGKSYQVDARRSDRELTDEERRALVVTLHAGAVGSWNWDSLANWDAGELQEWGFDSDTLANWQRDVGALGNLLASEEVDSADAEPQIDRAAELQEKWQVRPGDLWRIGEHRLACGDCTDRAVVERVLQGEKAEVLFTSPPYADVRVYKGNDLNTESLVKFISVFSETAFQVINLGIVRRDDEIIEYWNDYIAEARRAGYKLLSWNVWDKMMAGSIGNQSAMFAIEHEWLFVFGKKSKSLNRTVRKSPESFLRRKSDRLDAKGRHVRSVRQFDGEFRDSTRGQDYAMKNLPSVVQLTPEQKRDMTDKHPAIMPVSLPSVILEAMTTEFDVVAEPFLGSGTTLVACQNLRRRGRGIEISPEYCAVVLQRMSDAFPGIEIERVA